MMASDERNIIEQTADFVRSTLCGDASGHDWWHTYRVWRMAERIGREEGANLLTVQLAAILHDIADWKTHGGDFTAGSRRAGEWLAELGVEGPTISEVCYIIEHTSFKGIAAKRIDLSIEGQCVQDADRLDAMGAIGISRTFAFGGSDRRAIYDPSIKPVSHGSVESYVQNKSPSINHFYEKLLLLKDLMNTNYARQIAESRHRFMEEFLTRFYKEWEGEL